ncbi:hypothetical protein [Cupriavidus basilensis]|uniref:Uncharacterized protein n=1 Tax=Cupriavidus basilensis TaxID=68895 RepID=A0A643FWK1_9BURK|nr:hypothetical protein [Cupriavidus basilensis]QOT82249.1 hypothetical protein F7R26_039765 [Cupriavidus basilensis]
MGANDLTAMGGALPSVVSATGRLAIPVAHRDKMYLGDDQTLYIAGSYATDGGFIWGEEFTGIMKKIVNVVMAVSILIGASSFIGWIAMKMGASIGSCPA